MAQEQVSWHMPVGSAALVQVLVAVDSERVCLGLAALYVRPLGSNACAH